jgi:tripartite-type tricarboxylate transporter receptor subunit TctC
VHNGHEPERRAKPPAQTREEPMTSTRALLILSAVIASCGAGAGAQAQPYPNKPVRIISAYAAGGAGDLGARVIGQKLTEMGWPPVVIENRPGGGGAVGAQAALQAPADGYTLYQCDISASSINPSLVKDLSFDVLKDFIPITVTYSFPSVLVVPASSPAKTAADLFNLVKTKSGGAVYASQGVGSGGHLLGTMLQSSLGVPITAAHYRGSGQAMPDVATGRVDLIFGAYGSVRAYLQAGTVRPLAVTSRKRIPELADVPTMTEVGHPSVFFDVWFGLCARAGTPEDVVKTIHEKVVAAANDPDVVKRLAGAGSYVETSSMAEFRDRIKEEIVRYGKVIKDAGVTPQ